MPTAQVKVTVLPRPVPVQADAGADRTVEAGSVVTLDGTASAPSDRITSYAWSRVSGPSVSLTAANTATPNFAAPTSAGTVVLRLTVTDADGNTSTDEVSITAMAAAPEPRSAVADKEADTVAKPLVETDPISSASSDLTSIVVRWAEPIGATGTITYDVERSANGKDGWAPKASGQSAKRYTDTRLTRGTTYYYRVRSHSDEGTSDWLLIVARTQSGAPILVPTSRFTFQPVPGGSEIDVIWQPFSFGDPNETVTYRLERDANFATTNTGQDWQPVAHGISETKYKVSGLTEFTQYMFRVRAENDIGNSEWVEIYGITGGPTPDLNITSGSYSGQGVGVYRNPIFSVAFTYWASSGSKESAGEMTIIARTFGPQVNIEGELTDWLKLDQRGLLGTWLPEEGHFYAVAAEWQPHADNATVDMRRATSGATYADLGSRGLDDFDNIVYRRTGGRITPGVSSSNWQGMRYQVSTSTSNPRVRGTLNLRVAYIRGELLNSQNNVILKEASGAIGVDIRRSSR